MEARRVRHLDTGVTGVVVAGVGWLVVRWDDGRGTGQIHEVDVEDVDEDGNAS